jgi:hypothetical protein
MAVATLAIILSAVAIALGLLAILVAVAARRGTTRKTGARHHCAPMVAPAARNGTHGREA